ncbi:MAG: 3-phosphoshikimate 1-carboxyvinyltransferase [Clostridiales bacterium]|nr:3-phosphoshikimate 1-carboxyvinyltransferase [Clostridiales bacterium]
MNVTVTPGPLRGRVTPPASKSQSHRLIIAAALAEGSSRLDNLSMSQDIAATLGCMEVLGASWDGETVTGLKTVGERREQLPLLDCGESGSTLRFLIPVTLAVAGGGVFTGRGRLLARPMEPYERLFGSKGIFYRAEPTSITVQGALEPGEYALPGDISSQFITGLLFALPLLKGDSELRLTTPLESAAYVDMTVDALSRFGVKVHRTEDGWYIPGGQCPVGRSLTVEGDWSQAGFFYAARGLGNPVEICGMNDASVQGDRVIRDYAARLDGRGTVTLDVSQCPDLAPALAVRAALRAGESTHLVNATRLRMKESDRIETVTSELNRLGAHVEAKPDAMTICGVSALHGGETDSHNDHRIAMMLAIAATRATGPVTIHNAGSVAKSYPRFWEDYERLGGRITRQEE